MPRLLALLALLFLTGVAGAADRELFFVKVKAKDKTERTRIANAGVAIDGVLSDSVTFIGTQREVRNVKALGLEMEVTHLPEGSRGFPNGDSAFHDYPETVSAIDQMVSAHPDLITKFSIGKTVEGRDLLAVRISGERLTDSLPTAIFMGCHHAREHLSHEVPLMLAQYLVDNYASNARVHDLLNTREVWIIPMVNPDGVEFDIKTGSYKYWRKNRRKNSGSSYGVDLNRNYGGPNFGGEGASSNPSDETYHGPSAFSEPETQALRDFIRARKKATTLLTYHTFSELVLWPWGYTNDPIADTKDRKVFETMGKQMASWNKYKPEKSSDLYLTAGDTTDWAYSELKLFAFTFEMSPTSIWNGGFYPGAQAIQPVFNANLQPALYLIENSINPYDTIRNESDPLQMLD